MVILVKETNLELNTIAKPNVEKNIITICLKHPEKIIDIKPDDHIETDLAFDSLDKVGLQSFIESTFGMEVTQDKLISLGNVKEIAQYIHKQKTKMEVGETDWKAILSADNKSLPLSTPFLCFFTL